MFGPSRRQLLRILEREREQHDAAVRDLCDRLAHAYEKTWALPPRPNADRPLRAVGDGSFDV
jgi:hypothetical protein